MIKFERKGYNFIISDAKEVSGYKPFTTITDKDSFPEKKMIEITGLDFYDLYGKTLYAENKFHDDWDNEEPITVVTAKLFEIFEPLN